MRLGIDVTSLPYGTGVSRYTANLLKAIIQIDPTLDIIPFGSSLRRFRALKHQLHLLAPQSPARLLPLPPTLLAHAFNLTGTPITWLTGPIDICHSWDWYTPNPGSAALVSTIHDLALFKHPDLAHPQIQAAHSRAIRRLVKYRAHFIAVSEATRSDLTDLFSVPLDRITVIPEALPVERRLRLKPDQTLQTIKKFGLTKPFFLFVGTLEPRKNLPRQIEAWKHFRHDFDLVIVGAPGWETIQPAAGLHFLTQVTDTDLAALYLKASLLLYASLYEGFGLPILEAFYYRLPVVTSRRGSLTEVGGDAVVYADPESHASIIQAIGTALTRRSGLVLAGVKRLKLYDWSVIARQTLAVYKNAVFQNT